MSSNPWDPCTAVVLPALRLGLLVYLWVIGCVGDTQVGRTGVRKEGPVGAGPHHTVGLGVEDPKLRGP